MQDFYKTQHIGNIPYQEKQQTYENLHEVLSTADFEVCFSLCSTYLQLDELKFTKFFIIPQLKKYAQELNINCDFQLVTHYLQIIDAVILYDNFNENKTPTNDLILYRTQNFYSFLNIFCDLYNFSEFANFTNNAKVKKELLKIALKQQGTLDSGFIELQITDEVKKVLLNNHIINYLKSFRYSIEQKILFFENKLKFQQ